ASAQQGGRGGYGPPQGGRGGPGQGGGGFGGGNGGRGRPSNAPGGYDEPDPGAYPDAGRGGPARGGSGGPGGGGNDRHDERVHHAPRRLDPYDDQERALLALMIGLGKAGRDHLAALDPEDLRVPHVRSVAEWFKSGGDEGGQLPHDDFLASVARDIIMRSGTSDARMATLEVELAQLSLRRLERVATEMRRRGESTDSLAEEVRQARKRLDDAFDESII
ncbi:MAG: hypothetical protein Q7T55_18105, partial [Solirubrobacteraceae bacterium]|nr:hypothetical protein [Solirubrobacteraceae bacterium]